MFEQFGGSRLPTLECVPSLSPMTGADTIGYQIRVPGLGIGIGIGIGVGAASCRTSLSP